MKTPQSAAHKEFERQAHLTQRTTRLPHDQAEAAKNDPHSGLLATPRFGFPGVHDVGEKIIARRSRLAQNLIPEEAVVAHSRSVKKVSP